MRKGDFQKSRVYSWERRHVGPSDLKVVPFANIQAVVNHVWAGEGLLYPPKVREMAKQMTTAAGTGSRLSLHFPEYGAKTWVILHELAHSLTMGIGDVSDDPGGHVSSPHGPEFVWIYMKLLEKYMKMNLLVLMHTAKLSNVQFDPTAVPTVRDRP